MTEEHLSSSSSSDIEGLHDEPLVEAGASMQAVTSSPKEEFPLTDQVAPSKSANEESNIGTGSGIDQLLQRHRNELMYELRNLRHGQRPVTGQDNRRNVEDFFNNATQEGPSDTPPQSHRPEAVLVEVNALVERRPVSSALRRSGFINRLESTLEGAMSRISVRSPGRDAAPTQPRSTTHTEAPQLPRPTHGQPAEDVEQPRGPLPLPEATQESRAQAWLEQYEMPMPEEEQIPVTANFWQTLGQSHRDNLVMDISELLQQQLVTSTLESPHTRSLLESLVTNRLVQTGSNGRQVQQHIQSLPRSYHQRNDFSHLGLGPQEAQSLSDDVSVISATAAVTVHNAQSNAMSREMKSLQAQIKELKNMMRMSFDMQLDIQRAIRQEVAAAVSGALSGDNQSAAMQSEPIQEGHCLICLDKSVDAVLYQCGHMCVCYTCGQRLKSQGNNCPVCRAPIRDIIRSYKCSLE